MPKRPVNPKTRYYIRILAGLYLLHLAWSLRGELRKPGLLMLAAILFAVVGAAFIIFSARTLLQGEKDGTGDAPASDEETDYEVADDEEPDSGDEEYGGDGDPAPDVTLDAADDDEEEDE